MSLRLVIDVNSTDECPESIGLIVPLAPTTEYQRQLDIEISEAGSVDSLRSKCEAQSVLFVTPRSNTPMSVTYRLDLRETGETDRSDSQKHPTALPPEITTRLQDLLQTAPSMSEREQRIIDFAARHFSYGPLASTPLAEQLVCGLGSGNCIDINGFLLSAFAGAGIPARYYAGYYFPASDRPMAADGMHCWLSTHIEGERRYWDLPYLLKRGTKELRPGLEQLGGAYVAMSIGMGLAFDVHGISYQTHFLAHPTWLLPNGKVQPASVTCRADFPLSEHFQDQRDSNATASSSLFGQERRL